MSTGSDYSSFYDWLKKNDGQIHEHVKIDTRQERGLFVMQPIEAYVALAVIPRSLVINKQHLDLSLIQADGERQAMIFFLLREYKKNEQSFWFPWIKLLDIDKEVEELLKSKMQLFESVERSTLGEALTARYQQLQEEYEQLCQMNAIDASLELFAAIDHLVWSRILDLPDNAPLSLVPFIDFANHSLNANARWFIDDTTQNLILRSERALNENEEITISYGSKSNEELLYLYGFALSNNPNDRVTLPVSLLPEDGLLGDKLHIIRELHLPPRITFDTNGHLDEESLHLAKILSARTVETIDKEHEHYKPFLENMLNEYSNNLSSCSDDDSFVKYYLSSQKMIVQKGLTHLASS